VKTDEPATEGFVALLEPLIDTIIICTMTALTIVITGAWDDSDAARPRRRQPHLASVRVGDPRGSRRCSPVAVVLFAFSTMISWSYYGMKATVISSATA
jgi:AGCS family alanine or glycine:cation symporter